MIQSVFAGDEDDDDSWPSSDILARLVGAQKKGETTIRSARTRSLARRTNKFHSQISLANQSLLERIIRPRLSVRRCIVSPLDCFGDNANLLKSRANGGNLVGWKTRGRDDLSGERRARGRELAVSRRVELIDHSRGLHLGVIVHFEWRPIIRALELLLRPAHAHLRVSSGQARPGAMFIS